MGTGRGQPIPWPGHCMGQSAVVRKLRRRAARACPPRNAGPCGAAAPHGVQQAPVRPCPQLRGRLQAPPAAGCAGSIIVPTALDGRRCGPHRARPSGAGGRPPTTRNPQAAAIGPARPPAPYAAGFAAQDDSAPRSACGGRFGRPRRESARRPRPLPPPPRQPWEGSGGTWAFLARWRGSARQPLPESRPKLRGGSAAAAWPHLIFHTDQGIKAATMTPRRQGWADSVLDDHDLAERHGGFPVTGPCAARRPGRDGGGRRAGGGRAAPNECPDYRAGMLRASASRHRAATRHSFSVMSCPL